VRLCVCGWMWAVAGLIRMTVCVCAWFCVVLCRWLIPNYPFKWFEKFYSFNFMLVLPCEEFLMKEEFNVQVICFVCFVFSFSFYKWKSLRFILVSDLSNPSKHYFLRMNNDLAKGTCFQPEKPLSPNINIVGFIKRLPSPTYFAAERRVRYPGNTADSQLQWALPLAMEKCVDSKPAGMTHCHCCGLILRPSAHQRTALTTDGHTPH
jgi:hypothetical protein